jgi:hypothetical protein
MLESTPLVDGCTLQKFKEQTGLSKSTLYRYHKEGKLIFRKLGGITIVDGPSARQLFSQLPVLSSSNSRLPSRS